VNRLDSIFAQSRKVLVAYLCAGDPCIEETVDLARACIRAGADVIELGVPFSDPTADGPTITRASHRAIARGGGLTATLAAASEIRASDPAVGLVLFGYYNPLFVRGEARSASQAAAAGIDAFLVVDLPAEESVGLRDAAAAHGVGVIPLLAPTSGLDRVKAASLAAKRGPTPFVYYVSITGVTGGLSVDAGEAGVRAESLGKALGRPVVVGFGIDSRTKARAAAKHAAGVVVGTALVKAIENATTPALRLEAVDRLVRELRAGVDEAAA
jgi:tryptophan synthase alpha chain